MLDIKKLKVNLNKYKLYIIIGAVGIVLMLIPVGGQKKGAQTPSYVSEETEAFDFSVSVHEDNIEKLLSSVRGVGRVKVMLYLKSGAETVYISDGGYGSNVSKKLYPAFGGAVIVCDGGASPSVALNVTEAVASLTGLSSDKITVLQMK